MLRKFLVLLIPIVTHFLTLSRGEGGSPLVDSNGRLRRSFRKIHEGEDPHVKKVFDHCGFNKHCVKLCNTDESSCDTCIKNHTCDALVTMQYISDDENNVISVRTQMLNQQKFQQNMIYVAIALSDDTIMGPSVNPDIVVICALIEGAEVRIYAALMTERSINYEITDDPIIPGSRKFTIMNDAYSCEFEWKLKFDITNPRTQRKRSYDLIKDDFYILASQGHVEKSGSVYTLIGHDTNKRSRVTDGNKISSSYIENGEDYDEDYDDYYEGNNHIYWSLPFIGTSHSPKCKCSLKTLIGGLLGLLIVAYKFVPNN